MIFFAVSSGSRSCAAGESVGDTHTDQLPAPREIDTAVGREHIPRVHPAGFGAHTEPGRGGDRPGGVRAKHRAPGAHRSALSGERSSFQRGQQRGTKTQLRQRAANLARNGTMDL